MKILMISGSPIMGGAEIAARRLAIGLARSGYEVVYVGLISDIISEPGIFQRDLKTGSLMNVTLKLIRYVSYPLLYALNTKFAKKQLFEILKEERPDLINVHNIKQAFWLPEVVELCTNFAPTVWTLHDMSSFTGRCIHSFKCDGYITGCGEKCQSRHIPFIAPRSLTQTRWNQNKILIETHPDLVAVCPSRWLAERAKGSFWSKNRVEVIPNGLDLSIFTPIPMENARAELGLPMEGLLFLISALDNSSELKGGPILRKALGALHQKNFSLVTVGLGDSKFWENSGLPCYSLGYVKPYIMPYVYSAVNLLIHPSQADTLPNVIIEAMACGTPAIGFGLGGIPEIIRSEENGLIIENISASHLARTIDKIQDDIMITDPRVRNICRNIAEKEYDQKMQAERYMSLFSSMINYEN